MPSAYGFLGENMEEYSWTPPTPPAAVSRDVHLCACARHPVTAGVPLRLTAAGYLILGLQSGRARVYPNGRALSLGAGQGVLLPPGGETVLDGVHSGAALTAILHGALVERLLAETRADGCFLPHGGRALTDTVAPLLHACEAERCPSALEASAAAYALTLRCYRAVRPESDASLPPLVTAAIGVMQEEFSYLYGVEEVASRLLVTKEHLIRVFSAAVGVTPGKYLTGLRLEYAKDCLRAGGMSLEAVAAAAGFSGAAYFSRVFKQHYGMSPLTYAANAPRKNTTPAGELYL